MINGMKKHLCITFFLLSIIIIYYVYCNFDQINESFTSEPLEIKDGYDGKYYQDTQNYQKPFVYSKDQLEQVGSIQKVDQDFDKNKFKEDSKNLQPLYKNDKMLSNESELVPKGNIDYEDYDLQFTTTNIHRDRSNMSSFDKDSLKVDHKLNDKFDYGNDDCKNAPDIDLNDGSERVTCGNDEVINESPFDGNMSNYASVNFDYKIKEVTPKKKVMSVDKKEKIKSVKPMKVPKKDNIVYADSKNNHSELVSDFSSSEDSSLLTEDDKESVQERPSLKVRKSKKHKNTDHIELSDDNIVPEKKIDHNQHIEYDDEKCEVLRDGVEKLNDNGFLHNKQYSWNNTFKEDCGHY